MKKTLLVLSLASGFCLASNLFADPLTCKDLSGSWHGSFPSLSDSVSLSISSYAGQEQGEINFTIPYGQFGFGGLLGNCTQNPDGTVSMNLSRNNYGISSNLSAQLIDAHTLKVTSFNYSSYGNMNGNGSGTLTK